MRFARADTIRPAPRGPVGPRPSDHVILCRIIIIIIVNIIVTFNYGDILKNVNPAYKNMATKTWPGQKHGDRKFKMAVFSAVCHTIFYPSYLQDIRVTTCLETSKNRLYSLFKPVYVPYIYTWGKVSVEVFAVSGKLRGMSRKRVRYTFDVHFGSQEEKAAFVCRLKRVRELLSPEDGPPLEWFSSRGIIIYTFRAFARSFAHRYDYNTFLRVQHVL